MQVRLLDMSDPSSLAELQNYNLPKGAGPHGITIAPGERLVATSNYYVSHNGQGFTAPFTGTAERSIRLFTLAQDGNSFSPHPQVPYIDKMATASALTRRCLTSTSRICSRTRVLLGLMAWPSRQWLLMLDGLVTASGWSGRI
jgi:hypothetical protein